MSQILNLGCGKDIHPDAENHDLHAHSAEIDTVWNLDDMPWPWIDKSFDKIIARAVLEHLRATLLESVNECWRILKPGGRLFVKLPYWNHKTTYIDPTHFWAFDPETIDIFDPETDYGARYDFYTPYKWRIVEAARLNAAGSSFHCELEVRK